MKTMLIVLLCTATPLCLALAAGTVTMSITIRCSNSLDFSVPCNSQYVPFLL